jgi:hypothetical protein
LGNTLDLHPYKALQEIIALHLIELESHLKESKFRYF